MCKIEYNFFSNQVQKDTIEKQINSITKFFPDWLQHLSVENYGHDPDDPNCPCCVTTKFEYRQASVVIYNSFFSHDEKEMQQLLIHELLHIYHGSVNRFIKHRTIDYVESQNKDLAVFLSREYEDTMEGFTQDLTKLIVSLINKSN